MPPTVPSSKGLAYVLGQGDVLNARYRLEEKIGEGGMGTVFAARDVELDRMVAVKLLPAALTSDAEVMERFEREARHTARLDHPNIVPIYDVGRHEGRPFIVMKVLEGDTLAGLLRSKGGLTPDETVSLIRQLAEGLDFIHARGFIHRDIKAGNIMVGTGGHATILDFGILRNRDATKGLTREGMVMGTPHYMAPEQALGLTDVDHRVDLYALGVVLFECLTGTLPFEADSELRIIQMQAHEPPPELLERAPWVPKPVAAVVRRALAKRPEDRYASGAELARALEDAYREARAGNVFVGGPVIGGTTAPSWRKRSDGPSGPQPPVSGASPSPTPGAMPAEVALSAPPHVPLPTAPAPAPAPAPTTAEAPLPAAPRARRSPGAWVAGLVVVLGAAAFMAWPRDVPPALLPDAGSLAAVLVPRVAMAPDAAALEVMAPALPDAGEPDAGALAVLDAPLDAGHASAPTPAPVIPRGTKGRVNIVTTHKGESWWAELYLDGAAKGRTPKLLELAPGKYQVKVSRPGFKTEQREIVVAPGKASVLRIALSP